MSPAALDQSRCDKIENAGEHELEVGRAVGDDIARHNRVLAIIAVAQVAPGPRKVALVQPCKGLIAPDIRKSVERRRSIPSGPGLKAWITSRVAPPSVPLASRVEDEAVRTRPAGQPVVITAVQPIITVPTVEDDTAYAADQRILAALADELALTSSSVQRVVERRW